MQGIFQSEGINPVWLIKLFNLYKGPIFINRINKSISPCKRELWQVVSCSLSKVHLLVLEKVESLSLICILHYWILNNLGEIFQLGKLQFHMHESKNNIKFQIIAVMVYSNNVTKSNLIWKLTFNFIIFQHYY